MPTKIDVINRSLESHRKIETELISKLQECQEIIQALEGRKASLYSEQN
jgi:hypothetical protein